MSDFIKRSLILNEELATEVDAMAVERGKSFTAVVREALTFWLEHIKEDVSKEVKTYVSFTKDEQKLMDKLCASLSIDAAGVLKKCWKTALPALITEAQKQQQAIQDMNKTF